ncbi:MAG: type II secretion system F family protein [Candidatus Absconditabacteria bacterium]|nr:type II secretion system F family protein [Candidatus Absconditabacteria bacterium]MDD3868163.1 type II secretion system F family protein [Candidatus Absconditabacteria bacterium]MDD4714549.1 type II secretion system F family protein [Candidatus Absconditabacteria bacterium]
MFKKFFSKTSGYQHPFIDKWIASFMRSRDTSNFTGKEKIFFYKELVYMLRGGVSLMEAMNIIMKNSENFAVKSVAKEIAYYLNKGKELSYAISRLPEYFDEGDAAIIKTGEATGNLPVVVQALADEYAYLSEITQKYIGAMIYPVSLIVIGLAAVIYLFAFVLPGIFDTVASQASEIPPITAILMGISDFFVHYRTHILIFGGLGIMLLGVYFSTESGKRKGYTALMKLPIVGQMTKSYYLIKWARYMRLMISAGMDYVETFRLLRNILKIPLYQSMIEEVLADITLGKGLYEPLSKHRNIIPSNVTVLIKVGEETANLEHSMTNIIELYQEELDNSIKNFSKAIEPAILIVVGGMVMLIALGVFGLIFQVMDSAGI